MSHSICTLSGAQEVEAIVAKTPTRKVVNASNRVFVLLCALRDQDLILENTLLNERALFAYFQDMSHDIFRDALDQVSALACDSELNLLVGVLLCLIRKDGGHACLPL